METTRYDLAPYAAELAATARNVAVGSTLLFENARVRVWDITLAAGERLPFHRHRTSYFYRCHAAGLLRVLPDATAAVYATEVDEVHFREIGPDDLVVHDLENAGETTISFTTVELLGT